MLYEDWKIAFSVHCFPPLSIPSSQRPLRATPLSPSVGELSFPFTVCSTSSYSSNKNTFCFYPVDCAKYSRCNCQQSRWSLRTWRLECCKGHSWQTAGALGVLVCLGWGRRGKHPPRERGGQPVRDRGKGCELQTKQERDQEKVTETQRETEGDINIMRRTYIYTMCTHTARGEIPLMQKFRGRDQRARARITF